MTGGLPDGQLAKSP